MYRERKCRCPECRDWAAAQVRAYNERRRAETGQSYWQSTKPAAHRTRAGECGQCGKVITRTRTNDPLCALCRGNRPGYNIPIPRAERLAIYARDGWICQLCNEPVDPTVDPRTRWGATLDHIVPRSLGGSHDATNLRLAHRHCNSVRGARPDALAS